MSIQTYKKKRNFRNTPEPSDEKTAGQAGFSFVVHRHKARRLHYDLRLEMEGVLKSWAVPKGPSMIAGEKRLAIMVEDHPLSYVDFYGEIPEGNYGAGTMDIWDKGVYRSAHKKKKNHEQALLEGLREGNLKFIIQGEHLQGEFALVRLNEDKNEWLLIKKKDQYALDSFDVETIEPLQRGKGKKSSEQKPLEATEEIEEKPLGEFPKEVPSPMLAKLSPKLIDNPAWIYETKYDGYRLIGSVHKGKVVLWSRNGNDFTSKFEALADELKNVKDQVILDGEIVIENDKGISDFQLLQNYTSTHQGVLKYYVFDILFLNGYSTIDLSLSQRKNLLEGFFQKYSLPHIFNSPFQTGGGKDLFEELSKKGYEGVIAKAPDSTYLPGKRSSTWLKIKTIKEQEAIICGYTTPEGGRKYFGSILLGFYVDDKLKYAGNCGTGFNDATLAQLHEAFKKITVSESPFESVPKLSYSKGKPVWLKPQMVCSIKFTEWTDSGHMRHPVFLGLREDKDPEDVVKEKVDDTKEKGPEKKTITYSGKKVQCTNLNKIYWPEQGYTKGDLIAYYQSIRKYILPHLKDRPQSLNRFPNGIKGKSFYQKNMDVKQLPDWVKTEKVYSKSNKSHIDYLICNDAATLIYMANLGCIEINPWHSTLREPDKPTFMMLDLDPGEISFKAVVDAALAIKEICDELDMPSYCKTSGASGLHIYIPLAAKYHYGQVKTFAELMAWVSHKRLPSTTSIERSKAKRKDKIYLDFLQNKKGQTIAAPYSVRPQPLATVSTPLQWDEVNHQLSPQMFTILNMKQRLDKMGDIWKPVLGKGINLEKILAKLERMD